MSINWNQKHTGALIGLFKKHKCLWDIASPDFQRRDLRNNSYSVIYTKMRNLDKRITLQDIKIRWTSIRGQYRKELRQIEESKRSGGNVRKPRLWCFSLLHFLRPVTKLHPTTANSETDSSNPPSEVDEDSETNTFNRQTENVRDEANVSHTVCATVHTRKRTSPRGEEDQKFIRELKELQNVFDRSIKSERRFEWLGTQIVNTLNEMNNEEIIYESIEFLQKVIMKYKKRDMNYTLSQTDFL